MYETIRPVLFKLDPEVMHHITLNLVKWAGILPPTYALLRAMFEVNDPRLQVQAFGVKFRNPIGLAAGYDKDGVAVRGLSSLGFGHIELGTLTRHKQIGKSEAARVSCARGAGTDQQHGLSNNGVEALKLRRGARRSASTSARARIRPSNRQPKITWNCSNRCIATQTTWRSTSAARTR